LLANDLPEMLERATQLLQDDFDVVARAQNGQDALDEAVSLNPDLLLLDISMPILNGIEVAHRLRESGCQARIAYINPQGICSLHGQKIGS
jgi:CheY-like chemotaxis protein